MRRGEGPMLTDIPFPVRAGVKFALVPGFPGYCVGDDGSLWSRRRGHSTQTKLGLLADRWLRRKTPTNRRYPRFTLYRGEGGRGYERRLHTIVLEAFRGPCPEGMEGCHLNGNREDNRLENLRWGTPRSNAEDKRRHGTQARGERQGQAKLTEDRVVEIRKRWAAGATRDELALTFAVSVDTIRCVVYGLTWRHVGGAHATNWLHCATTIAAVAAEIEMLENEDFPKRRQRIAAELHRIAAVLTGDTNRRTA